MSCPGCGRASMELGGIAGFIEREVNAAVRKLAGHSELGTYNQLGAEVAIEYAVMRATSMLCVEVASPASLAKLCPELADGIVHRLSDSSSKAVEPLVAKLKRCTKCEPVDSRSFTDEDWLTLRKCACPCTVCQQAVLHLRLYANGEVAEADGTDRQRDTTQGCISTLMWQGLRRVILAKFLSSASEFYETDEERLLEMRHDRPAEEERLRAQVKSKMSAFCSVGKGKHTPTTSNLRFKLGDEVACDVGDGDWRRAQVIKLSHREFGWPAGVVAPYQVELRNNQRKCFARHDVDAAIRTALVPWPGQRVRLVGLQSAAMNGLLATVKADPDKEQERQELKAKGRIPVEVDGMGAKSLKAANLVVVRDGSVDDPEVLKLDVLIRTVVLGGDSPVAINASILKQHCSAVECVSCASDKASEYAALDAGLLCITCLVDVAANMAILPTREAVAIFIEDHCLSSTEYLQG